MSSSPYAIHPSDCMACHFAVRPQPERQSGCRTRFCLCGHDNARPVAFLGRNRNGSLLCHRWPTGRLTCRQHFRIPDRSAVARQHGGYGSAPPFYLATSGQRDAYGLEPQSSPMGGEVSWCPPRSRSVAQASSRKRDSYNRPPVLYPNLMLPDLLCPTLPDRISSGCQGQIWPSRPEPPQ
jgi:hypothetical protein